MVFGNLNGLSAPDISTRTEDKQQSEPFTTIRFIEIQFTQYNMV